MAGGRVLGSAATARIAPALIAEVSFSIAVLLKKLETSIKNMGSNGPPTGTIVFLRPEDSAADVEYGFYARVDSLADPDVVVIAVDSDGPSGPGTVDGRVALTRVVPTSELGGSQVSASLRKGVACLVGSVVRFGQVVATTQNQAQVNFSDGASWVEEAKGLAIVHPLVAILLFDATLVGEDWPAAKIGEADMRLRGVLTSPVASDGRIPSSSSLLDAIEPGLGESASVVGLRPWVESRTGKLRVTSVDHAIRYAFYVMERRPIPMPIRWAVGNSICADPACIMTAPAPAKRQCRGSFHDSVTSYDGDREYAQPRNDSEEEKSSEVQVVQPVGAMRTTCRMSAPAEKTKEPTRVTARRILSAADLTDVEGALLERLARDPEGYRLYLQLRSAGTTSGGKRQSKWTFLPEDCQVVVHNGITPEELQGTSPAEFVHRLMSPSAVPFTTHPAVLMRLYEYAFGLRGLSIMHLVALTMEERMRAQRDRSVNYNDFSGTVKLPDAKIPTSWNDLQDGVNGLVMYSNAYCDTVTRELAIAVSMFVSKMRALDNWPEQKLYALEFWINNQLGDYREMVAADARYGIDSRGEVAKRFDPSNPQLVQLQFAHINERHAEQQTQQGGAGSGRHVRPAGPGNAVARAIPSDVVAAIPRRDGRELCLKYASKRGCKDGVNGKCSFSDRGHFDASDLPAVVRAYIITKFGGLAPKAKK